MKNHDHQILVENTLKTAFAQGRISRREFMQGMLVAGLGIAGVRVFGMPTVARAQDSRPLTPTFYQWMVNLHPSLEELSQEFGDVNFQIAPVSGFDVSRFIAEASTQQSTWDVYFGVTPFVEMVSLIKAGVIEPWGKQPHS